MASVATATFADRLADAVERKRSQLVVGLDPRLDLLPVELRGEAVLGRAEAASAYARFCCGIVDAVGPYVVAVKPQAAFFEALGADGFAALERVCGYARSAGLLVIVDGKRGDIGSTARAYAAAYLEPRGDEPALADALTVNTYLGGDSVEPFLQACRLHGAGIFCLVRTSNAGAGDVQELTLSDGRQVWQHVAELVGEWGADLVGERGLSSVGAVVGATVPRAVAEARKLLPQSVLLLPGVGAQGATPCRCRSRFHERACERARDRIALGHLCLPRGERGLALGGGRRGGASPLRDLVGLRLVMRGHATLARYAAPAAFLLAATIAVLLVRAALSDGVTPPRRRRPRRRLRRRRRTRNPNNTGTGTTTTDAAGAEFYEIQAWRHAGGRRRPARHHGRAVARPQPGCRSGCADDRPALTHRRVRAAVKGVALLLVLATTLALAVVAVAAPPAVDAEAYVVQNSGTGEVLASNDARERLPMASITKLMTAIVALERASPDDVATISSRTASIGESTINLRPGERVTLRELIQAALIQSANDAANAIAAFVGRGSVSRFVELMNTRARQLGLTDTHFANPDGLDAPDHFSSAHDVTKLARVAMNKPFIRETVRLVDAEAAGACTRGTTCSSPSRT